jgi:hypothetical protein
MYAAHENIGGRSVLKQAPRSAVRTTNGNVSTLPASLLLPPQRSLLSATSSSSTTTTQSSSSPSISSYMTTAPRNGPKRISSLAEDFDFPSPSTTSSSTSSSQQRPTSPVPSSLTSQEYFVRSPSTPDTGINSSGGSSLLSSSSSSMALSSPVRLPTAPLQSSTNNNSGRVIDLSDNSPVSNWFVPSPSSSSSSSTSSSSSAARQFPMGDLSSTFDDVKEVKRNGFQRASSLLTSATSTNEQKRSNQVDSKRNNNNIDNGNSKNNDDSNSATTRRRRRIVDDDDLEVSSTGPVSTTTSSLGRVGSAASSVAPAKKRSRPLESATQPSSVANPREAAAAAATAPSSTTTSGNRRASGNSDDFKIEGMSPAEVARQAAALERFQEQQRHRETKSSTPPSGVAATTRNYNNNTNDMSDADAALIRQLQAEDAEAETRRVVASFQRASPHHHQASNIHGIHTRRAPGYDGYRPRAPGNARPHPGVPGLIMGGQSRRPMSPGTAAAIAAIESQSNRRGGRHQHHHNDDDNDNDDSDDDSHPMYRSGVLSMLLGNGPNGMPPQEFLRLLVSRGIGAANDDGMPDPNDYEVTSSCSLHPPLLTLSDDCQ